MLARTADNLFWLARQMERADFTARMIEATLRLEYLPRSGVEDPAIEWEGTLNAVGAYEASYVMGTGPGGEDDMPAEVTALINRYRVPVVA